MAIGVSNPFQVRIIASANGPPVWNNAKVQAGLVFTVNQPLRWPQTGTFQTDPTTTPPWCQDPENDTCTFTVSLSPLPSGLTFDPSGFWNWTGVSPNNVAVSGLTYTANDGHGHVVPSATFTLNIQGAVQPPTFAQPNPSYTEGQAFNYDLTGFISGWNPSTDVISITPGFTFPSWLSPTTGPNGTLRADGTQVDANDIPVSPGLRLRVTRTGAGFADCPAFGVTVNPPIVVSPGGIIWDSNYWLKFDYSARSGGKSVGSHYNAIWESSSGGFYSADESISAGDAGRYNCRTSAFGGYGSYTSDSKRGMYWYWAG